MMTAERFQNLADAYGGDIRRWPADAQAGAYGWLEDHAAARPILVEAGALDALLNAEAPLGASGVLQMRITASAPRRQPLWRQRGAWLSGAGLMAACAAGIILGASFGAPILSAPRDDVLTQSASAFDGMTWFDGLESEG